MKTGRRKGWAALGLVLLLAVLLNQSFLLEGLGRTLQAGNQLMLSCWR